MTRFYLALCSISLISIVSSTQGCAGQLDDESRFLDARPPASGGSSGAGGSPGSGGGMDSGGGIGCDYATILTATCATLTSCHAGGNPGGGIHLDDPASVGSLVGKPAPNGACVTNTSVMVVNASAPETSLLYTVLGPAMPPCGFAMPLAGTALSATQKACILLWIKSLPGVSGGDSGAQ